MDTPLGNPPVVAPLADSESQKATVKQNVESSTDLENAYRAPAVLLFKEDGKLIKKHFLSSTELSSHLTAEKNSSAGRNRLYCLHGLPLDYLQVLGAHFDIDPRLIDSHVYRAVNQLIGRVPYNAARDVRIFALDHVEMWIRPLSHRKSSLATKVNDIMQEPEELLVELIDDKELLGLLCHVTLITMRNANGTDTCKYACRCV